FENDAHDQTSSLVRQGEPPGRKLVAEGPRASPLLSESRIELNLFVYAIPNAQQLRTFAGNALNGSDFQQTDRKTDAKASHRVAFESVLRLLSRDKDEPQQTLPERLVR